MKSLRPEELRVPAPSPQSQQQRGKSRVQTASVQEGNHRTCSQSFKPAWAVLVCELTFSPPPSTVFGVT